MVSGGMAACSTEPDPPPTQTPPSLLGTWDCLEFTDGGVNQGCSGTWVFGSDGSVSAGGEAMGQLRLVAASSGRRADEDGRWELTGDEPDVEGGQTTVIQGYLEGSNVDAVRTATQILETKQHYKAAVGAFRVMVDDVVGGAIDRLGRA